MAKVKVGVIGVGVLGRHHARLYKECENAQLIGVYDVSSEQGNKIAEEFSTKYFADINELADQVDALSVATPTDLHFEVVKGLLEKKKHILVEKPITTTVEEANELVALAKANSCALMVGHVERFNPVMDYLEGKLDDPMFIEAHRLAPYPPLRPGLRPRGTEVGVTLDLMIHDIDVILHLVNSEVESVDAVGIPILSPTEDIANARIKFKNGCVANITASRVSPEVMRKVRVFQNNAYLSLDYQEKKGEVYSLEGMGINRENVPIDDHNALLKELEDFVSTVSHFIDTDELRAPRVSGECGAKALEIAVEITRQIVELQAKKKAGK
ncbi:MAG: Gfo/Idh/MocA family oxidoreductase [Lentisphaeraceae bacterium]|nr:Gfo/Idh/MocA family oxidoreductase [Lentisphaeraceae bacterium]